MDSERDHGVLIVVSGPSGTGKSTLCRAAMERFENLEFSVSHTTRPPRSGEVHGKDYFFIDDPHFDQMLSEEAFAEWAVVHGHRYGTSHAQIRERTRSGVNVILDIDPQGAAQIKRTHTSAIYIFLVPPDPASLRARLSGRGTESQASIERRLKNSIREIHQLTWYYYIIVNDDFDRALEKFVSVIQAEKCRRTRSSVLIQRLMATYGIDDYGSAVRHS